MHTCSSKGVRQVLLTVLQTVEPLLHYESLFLTDWTLETRFLLGPLTTEGSTVRSHTNDFNTFPFSTVQHY